MRHLFIGVDLSQTGLGLVAAWADHVATMEWNEVQSQRFGEPMSKDWETRALNLRKLIIDASSWVLGVLSHSVYDTATVVFEEYPMGGGTLHNIDKVAEVGGALRYRLAQSNVFPTGAPIASARKLLLGGLDAATLTACHVGLRPAEIRAMGKTKAAVWGFLKNRCGAPFRTPDECDAFVALNWGLHEAGLPCLASAPVEKPARVRKPRAKKGVQQKDNECVMCGFDPCMFDQQ